MPGIFLSHSSNDRAFVTKLAIDLVNRGFPVWFDSWELELGVGLTKSIYGSLDQSFLVLLLLSPDSVHSTWVERELTAALLKEEEMKRNFLIPVVVRDCEVPLQIRDRLRANFTVGYLAALESLCATLDRAGARNIQVDPSRQIIPLRFARDVYLDRAALQERLAHLARSQTPGSTISREQLVIEPGGAYSKLRTLATHRMEHIESDPWFSPEFFEAFSRDYRSLTKLERQLVDGVLILLNGLGGRNDVDAVEACYWYARDLRSELLRYFCAMQSPNAPDSVELSPDWISLRQSDAKSAEFYGVDAVERCIVSRRAPGGGMASATASVYVDRDSQLWRYFAAEGGSAPPVRLLDFGNPELYAKYLAPRILFGHQLGHCPLMFEFADLLVGIS